MAEIDNIVEALKNAKQQKSEFVFDIIPLSL